MAKIHVEVDVEGMNEELHCLMDTGYFSDIPEWSSVDDEISDWVGSNIGRFTDLVAQ